MKTNTIQVITTAAVTGLIAGFGSTTVTGSFFTGFAVAVSSWAMIGLIAIVASDYRSGSKDYFATKVATGHFQQVPVTVAPRACPHSSGAAA
jgi:hypothetical protein